MSADERIAKIRERWVKKQAKGYIWDDIDTDEVLWLLSHVAELEKTIEQMRNAIPRAWKEPADFVDFDGVSND